MSKTEWGLLIVLFVLFIRTWVTQSRIREDVAVTRAWVRQIHSLMEPALRKRYQTQTAAAVDRHREQSAQLNKALDELDPADTEEVAERALARVEREW